MSVNHKYYYLKLKENFFDTEAVKILESMDNGFLYTNILLKLYLRSLKDEGKLLVNENIPYTNEIIATLTGHDIAVVDKAIEQFIKLGLLEVLPNGVYYCSDIQLYVGKSSTEGDRKRKERQKITEVDKCPPEIELEKEIELDIEIKKEKYGNYENVHLSKEDLEALKKEFPSDYEVKIDNLSAYMASTGKSYSNHLATMRLWSSKEKTNSKDYSCGEEESL